MIPSLWEVSDNTMNPLGDTVKPRKLNSSVKGKELLLPIGFPQSYMPLIGTTLPGVLLLISFCRQRYICTASNQLRNKTEGVLPISFTKSCYPWCLIAYMAKPRTWLKI
ncbi:uncharacterized protein LOC134715654 [Mytilus trossulus]|uniref:uncharacterized protein LOC134715654 n=1 Tax=Mytilus trossulus TaxID=6551 RepID=UPI003003DEA7